MAEYIEKDKVLGLLHYNCDEACSAVVTEIESIPAADVALVRRGRWETKDGTCTCSVCGGAAIGREEEHGGFDHLLTRYCPDCGAKMDAGGQNAD